MRSGRWPCSFAAVCAGALAIVASCSPFGATTTTSTRIEDGGSVVGTDAGAAVRDGAGPDNTLDATPSEGGDATAVELPRYAAAVLAAKPNVYYRFEDAAPAADGALLEEVSKTMQGTTFGMPSYGQPGAVGAGMTFGGGQAIELPQQAFAPRGSFTIELWVKPDGTPTFSHILTCQDRTGGAKRGWALLWNNGISFERYAADQSVAIDGPVPVRDGAFTHVAVTYDSADGSGSLFIDGVLIKGFDDARAFTAHSRPTILAGAAVNELRWRGSVDELAIYAYALPFTEVAHHAALKE